MSPFAIPRFTNQNRLVKWSRGFTLIELIMVIVILGVIAVFAAPRLTTSDFDSRGLYDETIALLRYAQKTAIAQRRTVCVTFTSNTATLAMSTLANPADACATPVTLTGPRGETPPRVAAKGSVTYSATPSVLNFNGLGQPVDGGNPPSPLSTQTITVNGGPASITVQSVTGYVQ